MRKKNTYAYYRGDEFIDLGTFDELGERLNLKRATLKYLTTPNYHRKREKRNGDNWAVVIKIEDDDDE